MVVSIGLTYALSFLPYLKIYPYEINETSRAYNPGYYLSYHDFDNDGLSEAFEMKFEYNRTRYAVKLLSSNGGILDQWNIDEEWIPGTTIFGDYNNDRIDEVYFFSKANDTLFVNGIDYKEKEENTFLLRKGFVVRNNSQVSFKDWDVSITSTEMQDMDEDGFLDLVFTVSTRFALRPRQVYAYSVKKDSVVFKSVETGSTINGILAFDLDNDGNKEIFLNSTATANHKGKFPYDDHSAWLFALDHRLEFLFPPVQFPNNTSAINVFPVNYGKNMLGVIYNYRGHLSINNSIMLYDINGNKLFERDLERGKNWAAISIKQGTQNIIYLHNDDNIFELDQQLNTVNVIKFESFSFLCDAELIKYSDEQLVFLSDKKIYILDHDLNILASKNFNYSDSPIHYSVKTNGDHAPELAIQRSGVIRYFSLIENPIFSLKYFLYAAFASILFGGMFGFFKLYYHKKINKKSNAILFDNQSKGILILDHKLRVKNINGFFQQILKCKHQVFKDEFVFIALQECKELLNFINNLVKENSYLQEDFSFVHEDGPQKGKIVGTPVLGFNSLILGYVIELNDYSEVFQDEQTNIWSKTVQKMAHDIKTPLSSIQLNVQTLEYKLKDSVPETYRNLQTDFGLIFSEMNRVKKMTRDFLKFINTDKPNFIPCSLNTIINDTLTHFNGFIRDNILLSLDLDDSADMLLADKNQMEIVFHILIENAVEAIENKGSIIISSSLAQQLGNGFAEYLEIEIADSGKGICTTDMNNVFEPFFTTKTEGTGMGLVIAKKIIHDHHGKIEIVSRSGFSTVVRIMLPLGNIGNENVQSTRS